MFNAINLLKAAINTNFGSAVSGAVFSGVITYRIAKMQEENEVAKLAVKLDAVTESLEKQATQKKRAVEKCEKENSKLNRCLDKKEYLQDSLSEAKMTKNAYHNAYNKSYCFFRAPVLLTKESGQDESDYIKKTTNNKTGG